MLFDAVYDVIKSLNFKGYCDNVHVFNFAGSALTGQFSFICVIYNVLIDDYFLVLVICFYS